MRMTSFAYRRIEIKVPAKGEPCTLGAMYLQEKDLELVYVEAKEGWREWTPLFDLHRIANVLDSTCTISYSDQISHAISFGTLRACNLVKRGEELNRRPSGNQENNNIPFSSL